MDLEGGGGGSRLGPGSWLDGWPQISRIKYAPGPGRGVQ